MFNRDPRAPRDLKAPLITVCSWGCAEGFGRPLISRRIKIMFREINIIMNSRIHGRLSVG